jgi:hypothetical protein
VRLLPIIALLATLIVAAPASAANLQHNGPIIDFTVAPTDIVDLTVTGQELNNPGMTFTRAPGATPLTTGSGCSINIQTNVAKCGVGAGNTLRLTTADRADKIDASATTTPFDVSVPEQFNSAGGDDKLIAGPLNDVVNAGAGDDRITGGPGANQLHGDAGNDTFNGLSSGDVVDGGAGTDVLDLSGIVAGGVSVSLDGVANDGPLGSTANVGAIEEVRGTPSADVLTGGPAAETLKGAAGDDTINTRDGGVDVVDCGTGSDTARVDEGDTVTGCENVERAAAAPPGGRVAAPGAAAPGAPLVDADRDGVVVGADCDDARADVHPGARDKPGNGVDEDCSGDDAAFALVPARLSFLFLGRSDGTTKAATLLVRDVPAGGKVQLRCSGRGCPFRTRAAKVTKGSANLAKLLKRRLRAKAIIEVRVTAPDFIGTATRFTMRDRGRAPKKATLCLAPGATKPGRCT